MCFQVDDKSAQEGKCVNSRIMNNIISCVLFIDTFEQQCVVIKVMFLS